MLLNRDIIRRLGSSKFNYWFGYVANLSLVVWFVSHAFTNPDSDMSYIRFTSLASLGLLSWTLSEYMLHRYVYHAWPSFLSTGHDLHHQNPKALIGVPWYLTSFILVTLFKLVSYIVEPATLGVVLGFNWLGYIAYCLLHHGSHHWSSRYMWLRHMKKHHLLHHAYPAYNWGFTTSLWDIVFRTHWQMFSPEAKQRRHATNQEADMLSP